MFIQSGKIESRPVQGNMEMVLTGIPRMNAEPAGIFALFPHSGKIGWWHG
jgi:hypothetical protein